MFHIVFKVMFPGQRDIIIIPTLANQDYFRHLFLEI